MVSEWLTLADVCEVVTDGSHFSPEAKDGTGYYMASVRDMRDYGFDFSECKTISEDDYLTLQRNGCCPKQGDILIGKDGANYFLDAFIYSQEEHPAILSSIAILRPNKQLICPEFLFAYLRIPSVIQDVRANYRSGSAIPRIVLKDFKRLPIWVPSLEKQRQIACVYASFDNLIKTNQQINEHLLEIARLQFRESMMQDGEMNSDIELIPISDIPHTLETGRRPKGGAVSEGIPSVGAENVKQIGVFNYSSNKFIPADFAERLQTGKVNGYELMIYKDGGKPGQFIPHFSMFGEGFPYEEFFINEHVFKLDFGNRGLNEFAYFYFHTSYVMKWLETNGAKAAIPGINKSNIEELLFPDPESECVVRFAEWVQPFFVAVFRNCRTNMDLISMRNALLPKMMAGEIDVSKVSPSSL